MKRFKIFLATLLLVCNTIFAQQVVSHYPARQGGFWSIGLNGGFAYQSSDIRPTFDGFGFGLTVAKNAFYRPGAFFSYDWRGRLLYDESYGADTKRSYGLKYNNALNGAWDSNLNYNQSPGYVYANHKTQMFELGLEGVLTLNRLRERTGIVASVFGGIGVDWYNTYTDQSNGLDIKYNYRSIDSTFNVSSTRALLNATRDGYHESAADGNDSEIGNIRIMPGAGVELGYQFSPRFYAGISHKITFSRTNLLDGAQWANDNTTSVGNDWAHYTSLQMVWELRRRERAKIDPPIIEVTTPTDNPYRINRPSTIIGANIKNVREKSQSKLFVNGIIQDHNFNNPKFYQEISLRKGENEVKITATNAAGSDSKTITIIYDDSTGSVVTESNPTRPNGERPEVRMRNPNEMPKRTYEQDFTVVADITNVDKVENIVFRINGYDRRFDFNSRTGELMSNIRLSNGRNEIRIVAKNQFGEDTEDGVVILERNNGNPPPVVTSPTPNVSNPPTVRISSPANNTTSVENIAAVTATTQNVTSGNQILVTVNGNRVGGVNFSSRTGVLTFNAPLTNNTNNVLITVENNDGKATDALTLKYLAPLEPKKLSPRVEILTPSDNATFSNSFCNLTAKVLNVERKSDVTVRVNGVAVSDFNFSTSRQVSCDVKLNIGNNTIAVNGTNANGSDEASINVRYERESRPPSVEITIPSSDISTDQATQTVRATLRNVNNRNEVKLLINGVSSNVFDFNGDRLDTYLKLKEGNNQVVISVSNSDGTAKDQVNINYTAPRPVVLPPTVSFVRPSESGTTVASNSYALVARIQQITSKNQIALVVNNRTVNNFAIVNGEVRATVTLTVGNNNIRITATNESGKAEDNTSIRLQPEVVTEPSTPTGGSTGGNTGKTRPQTTDEEPNSGTTTGGGGAPTKTDAPSQGPGKVKALRALPTMSEIGTTVPAQDPSKPLVNTCGVSATFTNIGSADQISMTVNGASVTNFEFSAGKLTYSFGLKSGKNTITIVAQNRFGNVNKSVDVNF